MKKTTEEQMSRCRQRMQELGQEYMSLAGELLGRGPLVRGTLNWHERASGRYPGITRGEGGTVVGRRVRLEHVACPHTNSAWHACMRVGVRAWLKPLLERHKAYRQAEARLRKVHREAMAVAEELRQARLYDYEPKAAASAFLAKAKGVRHGA